MSTLGVRRWTYINAGLALSASAVALIFPSSVLIVPALGTASLALIWLLQDSLRVADIVTALRAAGGVLAFTLGFFDGYGTVLYISILAASELMDFFDGLLARKAGGTPFGEIWDMETDAFFILLLSIAAWRFGGFGIWVVIPGLFRYLFLFLFIAIRPVPISSRLLSWFMKTACVIAVIGLIAANAGFFNDGFRIFSLVLALGSLGVSFLWETAYYLFHRNGTK